MKPPPKPFKLPPSREDSYYPRPLLSWVMVAAYNDGTVEWKDVEPYLEQTATFIPELRRRNDAGKGRDAEEEGTS